MLTSKLLCLQTDQYTKAWPGVTNTDSITGQMKTPGSYSKLHAGTYKYKLN
jgi:hypothetical protein